ncbi:hypothetical protein AGMMS49992_33080 [Clostridia bacterium]|nr:hypothetical protein AGMMS49992_33080 [Clostridia bacterium]
MPSLSGLSLLNGVSAGWSMTNVQLSYRHSIARFSWFRGEVLELAEFHGSIPVSATNFRPSNLVRKQYDANPPVKLCYYGCSLFGLKQNAKHGWGEVSRGEGAP